MSEFINRHANAWVSQSPLFGRLAASGGYTSFNKAMSFGTKGDHS